MSGHRNDTRSRANWSARAFSILAFVIAGSTGCTDLHQHQGETAPYLEKGSASISGVVTIDTGQTQITAPASTRVYLTPATTLSNERLQDYAIEKNALPEERESQLVTFGRTNAQGGFRFVGLAPGDYILVSEVHWVPAGGPALTRSDVAYARVRLSAGESATVAVTRRVSER